MAKQFRWIWRHDDRQHLVRVCVVEDLVSAFKFSLALHCTPPLHLFHWRREWDGFFLTVLGIRVHYRRAHRVVYE